MEKNDERSFKVKPAILIIDDNPVNLRAMKVYLDAKFEVIPVKSGQDGLNVLKTRKIDLILLDIEMPVMSGFDFLKQLKDVRERSQVPVICVTGHDATPEFIGSVIHAGAIDFITKPVVPAVLTAKVHKILRLNEFVL